MFVDAHSKWMDGRPMQEQATELLGVCARTFLSSDTARMNGRFNDVPQANRHHAARQREAIRENVVALRA